MNDIDILKSALSGNELEIALEKYKSGIPTAYILGEWEFFGDRYYIDENCLIPRCDTERVVEKIIGNMQDGNSIADLCTGTGCIVISVLKRKPKSKGIAVDISENAVRIARKNAVLNGVENRLNILCDNIFIFDLGNEKFDIISSNPPYIPTSDLSKLDEYVKREPSIALDGGADGMDFYKFIVKHYQKNLKENGKFIFEIGFDQEEKIKAVATENNFTCTVTKDYSGNPRVALLQKQ